jgi:hypothetical protein
MPDHAALLLDNQPLDRRRMEKSHVRQAPDVRAYSLDSLRLLAAAAALHALSNLAALVLRTDHAVADTTVSSFPYSASSAAP